MVFSRGVTGQFFISEKSPRQERVEWTSERGGTMRGDGERQQSRKQLEASRRERGGL